MLTPGPGTGPDPAQAVLRAAFKAFMLLTRRDASEARLEARWGGCLVLPFPSHAPAAPRALLCLLLLLQQLLSQPGVAQMRRDWLAGHSRDPVTPLMRERKQFIAPNKCYSTNIRQPPLLPLTLTFRFCTTANSDFKLFLLPDSASL